MNVVDLIVACAKVPSFSSYEERMHPLIRRLCAMVPGVRIEVVHRNNLILFVPGKRPAPPIALTAHMDKIDHFSPNVPEELPVEVMGSRIIGQMDDTAGMGVCLAMMFRSLTHYLPPMYILLSEMEEGLGLRKTPDLLRNSGIGYTTGMGAKNVAKYLIENKNKQSLPKAVITIDTTPKFKGAPGIALYNKFWHRDRSFIPSSTLLEKTQKLESYFTNLDPDILVGNANNDYIGYGITLNTVQTEMAIPSIAIEPAIYPYHQRNEGIFCEDVEKIVDMLTHFLENADIENF